MTGMSGRPGPDPVRWPERAAAPCDRRRRDEVRRRLRAAVLDRASALMPESWSGDPTGWLGLPQAIDLAVAEYELLLEALRPLAALTSNELGGR